MKRTLVSMLSLVVLLAPGLTVAQGEQGAGLIDVRIMTVAQGRGAEWQSLMKERSEVLQAMGQPFFHIFQRVRGPAGVFLIITPHNPIDVPVTATASANWLNMIPYTVASQSLVTLQAYPGTNDSGSVHPGGRYMFSRLRTVAAGRNADYEEWLGDELIPALREAGAGDVRVLRNVVGGSPRNWVTFSFIDSWPQADGPDLDPGMLNEGDEMVVAQTNYLYAFRDDLSFTAN